MRELKRKLNCVLRSLHRILNWTRYIRPAWRACVWQVCDRSCFSPTCQHHHIFNFPFLRFEISQNPNFHRKRIDPLDSVHFGHCRRVHPKLKRLNRVRYFYSESDWVCNRPRNRCSGNRKCYFYVFEEESLQKEERAKEGGVRFQLN